MSEVFIDLTKDRIISFAHDKYVVYKEGYPGFLFKGPYLRESEEYARLTHFINVSKDLKFKYAKVPEAVISYSRMFKTGIEDLDSKLYTIKREFMVILYTFDVTTTDETTEKIGQVPEFIVQELQSEDLSRLINLSYRYTPAKTYEDYMENIIELYKPTKSTDKIKREDDLIRAKSRVFDTLSHDSYVGIFVELCVAYIYGYSVSPDQVFFDIIRTQTDTEKRRSKAFINLIDDHDYTDFNRNIKNGYFSLTPGPHPFMVDFSISYFPEIFDRVKKLLKKLPKYIRKRATIVLKAMINVVAIRSSKEYTKYPGIPYPPNLFWDDDDLSSAKYEELPDLGKLTVGASMYVQVYPSMEFYNESVAEYYRYLSSAVITGSSILESGDILLIDGEPKTYDGQTPDSPTLIYKQKYGVVIIGPYKNKSRELYNLINLDKISTIFDIRCYKKFLGMYKFTEGYGFSVPFVPNENTLFNHLSNSSLENLENDIFRDLVFDLIKLYIFGVDIDLNKLYVLPDGVYGFDFTFGSNIFLNGSHNLMETYLIKYSDVFQKLTAEFNFSVDIPSVDVVLEGRKKQVISILRNFESTTKSKNVMMEYVLPLEPESTEKIKYNKGNYLDSTTSGVKVSYILDLLENAIVSGDVNSSITLAFRVYSFILMGKYDVVLSLYNRLLTIAMRCLSPETLDIQSYICTWVVYWIRGSVDVLPFSRDTETVVNIDGNEVILDKRLNPNRLIRCIVLLCGAEKTNIIKVAWRASMVGDLGKYGIEKASSKNIKAEDRQLLKSPIMLDFVAKEDMDRLSELGNMILLTAVIYNRLRDKNLSTFSWIKVFLQNYNNLEIKKRRYNGVVWNIFLKLRNDKLIKPIYEAYNSDSRYWFLSSIILNILQGRDTPEFNFEELDSPYSVGEGLSALLSDDCEIPIIDTPIIPNEVNGFYSPLYQVYQELPYIEQLDMETPN